MRRRAGRTHFPLQAAHFIDYYSDVQDVKILHILLILCLLFDVFIEMLCGKIKHKNLFLRRIPGYRPSRLVRPSPYS